MMKLLLSRIVRLIAGSALFSLGVALTIRADIGYAPWEVLHAGIANVTGLKIGMSSIIVSVIFLVIVTLLGEKLGFGSLFTIVFIGVVLDVILPVIPLAEGFAAGIIMLAAGLFIVALATYFYIGSGYGSGPRDSLMVALVRITKMPVGACRAAIEIAAVAIGWALGGMAGAGTVISAFGIGFCVQITFAVLKFDAAAVEHETLAQTYRAIKGAIK
jgi:uncharacterized membrane protein YczE